MKKVFENITKVQSEANWITVENQGESYKLAIRKPAENQAKTRTEQTKSMTISLKGTCRLFKKLQL